MTARRVDGARFEEDRPIAFVGSPPVIPFSPHLSDDGRTLLFVARTSTGPSRIMAATRASAGDPFGAPVVGVQGEANEDHFDARPTKDGVAYRREIRVPNEATQRSLVLTRPNGGTTSLLAGAPANVAHPVVAGEDLYYSMPSNLGGSYDVFRAVRDPQTLRFASPQDLGIHINTDREESPGWVSPDECVMYFERAVGNSAAYEYRLYRAERR